MGFWRTLKSILLDLIFEILLIEGDRCHISTQTNKPVSQQSPMYVNGHEQNHRFGVPPLWQNLLHGRHSFDNTCVHDPFGQDDVWWTSLVLDWYPFFPQGDEHEIHWFHWLVKHSVHIGTKMFLMTAGNFQHSWRPCYPFRRSAAKRWWAKVLEPDKESFLLSRFRWETLFVFNMREMKISSICSKLFLSYTTLRIVCFFGHFCQCNN